MKRNNVLIAEQDEFINKYLTFMYQALLIISSKYLNTNLVIPPIICYL